MNAETSMYNRVPGCWFIELSLVVAGILIFTRQLAITANAASNIMKIQFYS